MHGIVGRKPGQGAQHHPAHPRVCRGFWLLLEPEWHELAGVKDEAFVQDSQGVVTRSQPAAFWCRRSSIFASFVAERSLFWQRWAT